MTGQAIARVNGTTAQVPEVAGRKGFKAELNDVRERMRGLGFGFDEIAAEMGRRYRLRPREAYRLAYGWTLDHAAARFNAQAARDNMDPQARASLTGGRLCEYEKWPSGDRKPSVYVLLMLAQLYDTDVLCLLDLADHEHIAPQDRLVLLRRPRAETPFGEKFISLMAARGLSLREVARRVPCSPAYLSNITHGRRRPSEEMAVRLDDVLTGDGELAALAEMPAPAREHRPGTAGNSPGHAPGPLVANPHGISLSLPCVLGRLVIEISGPGQETESERGLSLVPEGDAPA